MEKFHCLNFSRITSFIYKYNTIKYKTQQEYFEEYKNDNSPKQFGRINYMERIGPVYYKSKDVIMVQLLNLLYLCRYREKRNIINSPETNS